MAVRRLRSARHRHARLHAAADWAMKKFNEWGLKNVHVERFPFGQGWTIDRFSVHLLTPQPQALIGQPRWYSPSTNGTVLVDVVYVEGGERSRPREVQRSAASARSSSCRPARPVRMLEDRVVLRMNDEDWAEAMKRARAAAPAAGATPAAGPTPQQFAQLVQRFLVAEGAAAVLDRGGDGDLVRGRQRPVVADAARRRRHDLPGQRRQPRSEGAEAGAVGDARRRALQPPGAPARARSAGADGGEHPDEVPSGDRSRGQRVQHHRGDSRHRPRQRSRDHGRALRHLSVRDRRHRQHHRIVGDDRGGARHPGAGLEAAPHDSSSRCGPPRNRACSDRAPTWSGTSGTRRRSRRSPGTRTSQAYFNLDNGTGRILGIWGQGNTGAHARTSSSGASALKDIGWKNVSPRSVTQTDHGSFEEAGMPGFQFIQERLEYNSRTHHSNMDTFDHVQKDEVSSRAPSPRCSRGRPRTRRRSCRESRCPQRSSRSRPGRHRPCIFGG